MSRKRILGAVIAGGQSRQFGSDKALAMIDGQPMIGHVIAALAPQVDALVICGRAWLDFPSLADRRQGKCGPLAGLEAALWHARDNGYDGVLSAPVDTLPVPTDLAARLVGSEPAAFQYQTLIGYWPIACLDTLIEQLAGGELSVCAWLMYSNARSVGEPFHIGNINRPSDLSAASDGALIPPKPMVLAPQKS